jgi:hypothetical protein
MARRSRPSNPKASDLIRLTKAESKTIGAKPSSKRYKIRGEKITKNSATYSDRFHHSLQLSERAGRKVKKEALKKREVGYASPKAAQRVKDVANARSIRSFVPQMTDRDMRLALKRERVGHNGLSEKEKQQFRNMFARYPRGALRQAFGSAETTGSFAIAA